MEKVLKLNKYQPWFSFPPEGDYHDYSVLRGYSCRYDLMDHMENPLNGNMRFPVNVSGDIYCHGELQTRFGHNVKVLLVGFINPTPPLLITRIEKKKKGSPFNRLNQIGNLQISNCFLLFYLDYLPRTVIYKEHILETVSPRNIIFSWHGSNFSTASSRLVCIHTSQPFLNINNLLFTFKIQEMLKCRRLVLIPFSIKNWLLSVFQITGSSRPLSPRKYFLLIAKFSIN